MPGRCHRVRKYVRREPSSTSLARRRRRSSNLVYTVTLQPLIVTPFCEGSVWALEKELGAPVAMLRPPQPANSLEHWGKVHHS